MRCNGRLAKLERAAGPNLTEVDITQLTDAELETLHAAIPAAERAWLAQLTDAELKALIADAH